MDSNVLFFIINCLGKSNVNIAVFPSHFQLASKWGETPQARIVLKKRYEYGL